MPSNDINAEIIFTGFTGPAGTGESDERLYVCRSTDGIRFECHMAAYAPALGTVRDPSPLRVGTDWLIAHTTVSFGGGTYFGIARSADMLNWTPVHHVDMTSIAGIDCVWAPEWFVDEDGSPHILCTTSCDGGCTLSGSTFQMYIVSPEPDGEGGWDFTRWGLPRRLTSEGEGTDFPVCSIDPFLVRIAGLYCLWYKDDQTGAVEFAASSFLEGPYLVVRRGDWAGFQAGNASLEGPFVVQIQEGHWRLYADVFRDHYQYFGLHYSDSFDDWETWTPLAPCESNALMRHGTARLIREIPAATENHDGD